VSISGKYLTCSINGVEIAGNYAWDADEGGDVLDATVGADRGWERENMGVQNLHVTIKGYMDVSTGQYTRVRRGAEITNLELYRHIDDATPAFSVSEALAVRSRQGGEVRGKVEWSCEVHSQGDVVTYNDPS